MLDLSVDWAHQVASDLLAIQSAFKTANGKRRQNTLTMPSIAYLNDGELLGKIVGPKKFIAGGVRRTAYTIDGVQVTNNQLTYIESTTSSGFEPTVEWQKRILVMCAQYWGEISVGQKWGRENFLKHSIRLPEPDELLIAADCLDEDGKGTIATFVRSFS